MKDGRPALTRAGGDWGLPRATEHAHDKPHGRQPVGRPLRKQECTTLGNFQRLDIIQIYTYHIGIIVVIRLHYPGRPPKV